MPAPERSSPADLTPFVFRRNDETDPLHQTHKEHQYAIMSPDKKRLLLQNFIEEYERLPVLWNTKNKNYTKKYKRKAALDKLLVIYKKIVPHATRDHVKRKINSLKTNYNKELKKIERSKQLGRDMIYTPLSWTFYALQFLNKSNFKFENEAAESEEERGTEHSSGTPSPIPHPRKIMKITKIKGDDLLDKSYKLLPPECSITSSTSTTEDIDPVAIVWSRKLQKLNHKERLLAEKAINDILFDFEIKNLDTGETSGLDYMSTPDSNRSSPSPIPQYIYAPVIHSPTPSLSPELKREPSKKNGTRSSLRHP